MRAAVVKSYAHPSKIPISHDAPEPKPGKDQVVVEVYSAGLNFFDVSAPSIVSHAEVDFP